LVARSENLPYSRVDDSIIAIDSNSGFCFAMNVTTARIWELLSSPMRVDALCESLCGEFKVDPETCRVDVVSILCEMRQNGLLKESI